MTQNLELMDSFLAELVVLLQAQIQNIKKGPSLSLYLGNGN